MKYITLTAKTYEDAIKKARDQYGDRLRIHSRKDYTVRGFLGLGHRRRCDVTCYLTGEDDFKERVQVSEEEILLKRFEQEAKTPSPDAEKEENRDRIINQFLEKANQILKINDFSEDFTTNVVEQLKTDLEKAYPRKPDEKQYELMILDKIAASFEIDYSTQNKPPRCTVILGTTGTGKTTTVAKISAMYGVISSAKENVKIITLDSFRIGAFEQIESFGKSLGIPVYRVTDKQSFTEALQSCSDADLILVDTIGKSPRDGILSDRLSTLLSVCPEDTGYYVAVNASMKTKDIEMALKQFANYKPRSIIITKVDETYAVGNIISICAREKLPILYVTDGQKVPSNIHKASNSYLMSLIRGLSTEI